MRVTDRTVSVNIQVRSAGEIEFQLLQAGESQTVFTKTMQAGKSDLSFVCAGVAPGFYHLVMLNEGRVAHYQEVTIK